MNRESRNRGWENRKSVRQYGSRRNWNDRTRRAEQRREERDESRLKGWGGGRRGGRERLLVVTKVGLCQPLTSLWAPAWRTRFHEPAMQDPSKDADMGLPQKGFAKKENGAASTGQKGARGSGGRWKNQVSLARRWLPQTHGLPSLPFLFSSSSSSHRKRSRDHYMQGGRKRQGRG